MSLGCCCTRLLRRPPVPHGDMTLHPGFTSLSISLSLFLSLFLSLSSLRDLPFLLTLVHTFPLSLPLFPLFSQAASPFFMIRHTPTLTTH